MPHLPYTTLRSVPILRTDYRRGYRHSANCTRPVDGLAKLGSGMAAGVRSGHAGDRNVVKHLKNRLIPPLDYVQLLSCERVKVTGRYRYSVSAR
jgi:hypothetical protein